MDKEKSISIMIHDLNPWGGQDRSMLEIAWQLNKEFPLEIHSFSLEGYENWPNMKHHQYEAKIKRPVFFKYMAYHIQSWLNLRKQNLSSSLIQSTGTASLKSDIVQVQFIHNEWQKIAQTLPQDKISRPFIAKRIYHSLLNRYKLFLENKVYTTNKKYIAISHTIKKELMTNFNIPEENIAIIHHGVDLKYFTPPSNEEAQKTRLKIREDLDIKPEDTVFLHVGALNARKGIFKSLEVLAYLKDQGFTNLKYLAVGQGDPKILKTLIQKYNLEDVVIFAPHSKDIRTYYWAADLFFFPTYYEPFGLVILEAMACGLPVVTSNTAGGAELIKNNENGILFSPSDSPDKIANALNPILKDKSLAEKLSQNALDTAQDYSWEKVGKKYQQFYFNC